MGRIPRPTIRGALSMVPSAVVVVTAFCTFVLTVSSGQFGLCGFSAVVFVLACLAASVAGLVTRALSPIGFALGLLLGLPACALLMQGFLYIVREGVKGMM